MLILLPPSETKRTGGTGGSLDPDALVFPELRGARATLMAALADACRDTAAARGMLRVSARKDDEIAANVTVAEAPTLPALDRYTGVLYDALQVASFTRAGRARAAARLMITSALFGIVRGNDAIPFYRLSAGARLPGMPSPAPYWRAHLRGRLEAVDEPILDLRSGAYAAFARLPDAVTVRVVTVRDDGSRTVVSHFNKAAKGSLARLVALSRRELATATDVVRRARAGGLSAEQTGPRALEIVT